MTEQERNEHERKVTCLLGHIARGSLTLDQLRRAVADGKADVKRLGRRVEPTTLDGLAAAEEALDRIECELARLGQRANN